jgi:N-acetylmuramoyl-L-alanine amidase
VSGFAPDHAGAKVRPSPNCGPRRDGLKPSLIVLHYTGMDSARAAEDWLCDPRSEVSAHYLVHEDGSIVQMVRESERAWHAGASCWWGQGDVNSRSIGIEIANPGHAGGLPPFPDAQIEAVIELCRGIMARHAIGPEGVVGHSDVAPGRKADPGERFPWRRLVECGICIGVEPVPLGSGQVLAEGDHGPDVARLQERLAACGYCLPDHGRYEERTRLVVEAFQRRHRPELVDGRADFSTRETLDRLVARFPIVTSVHSN